MDRRNTRSRKIWHSSQHSTSITRCDDGNSATNGPLNSGQSNSNASEMTSADGNTPPVLDSAINRRVTRSRKTWHSSEHSTPIKKICRVSLTRCDTGNSANEQLNSGQSNSNASEITSAESNAVTNQAVAISSNLDNEQLNSGQSNLNASEITSTESNASSFAAGEKTWCHLTPGHFDQSKLLYTTTERQLYKKNKYTKQTGWCYWVCQNCPARVRTKGDPTTLQLYEEMECWFVDSFKGHSGHKTKEMQVKKLQKMQELKDAVSKSEPSTSTKTSVAREQFDKLVSPNEAVALGIGPSKNMRTLTKKYAAKFPESPKTIAEIVEYFNHPSIIATTGQTLRGTGEMTSLFFKHAFEDKDVSFCLFASDDVIAILNEIPIDRRLLFCDGTFKICPYGPFRQMLILSINICGQVIPFVYCLMSNRKKATYEAVFRWINDQLGITDGLKCKTFMADFEIAMVDGFKAVVPTAEVDHCHFHFAQAVKRNAKKCTAMMNFCDRDTEAMRYYFKFLCLPLLPAREIKMAFEKLKLQVEAYQDFKGFEGAFSCFLGYFHNQWISSIGHESPETISVFGNIHRTNNAMESLNRLLNAKIMGGAHLSRFYLGLRQIEKSKAVDAKLAKDTGGASKAKQKTKAKARDNFVFEANQDLNRGVIDAEEFLTRLTSEYNGFCKEMDECCVAELDYFEIDEQSTDPPNKASHLCQFCEDREAVVAFDCTCQQLCLTCFKDYASTFTITGRRETTETGNPVVNAQNPLKCPHCTVNVTNYIITRR